MLVLILVMIFFTYLETRGLTLEGLARSSEDDETMDLGAVEKTDGIEIDPQVVNVDMEEKA